MPIGASHSGAELDLLVFKEGKSYGFEVKYSDAPSITKSMKVGFVLFISDL